MPGLESSKNNMAEEDLFYDEMMRQVLQIVLEPVIPELCTNLIDDADTPELSISIPAPSTSSLSISTSSSPSSQRKHKGDTSIWYWQQVTEGMSLADIPPITPPRPPTTIPASTISGGRVMSLPTVFRTVEESVEPLQESGMFSTLPTPRTTTSESNLSTSASSYCDSNGYGVEGLFKNLFKWKMFVTSQRKKVLASFNS